MSWGELSRQILSVMADVATVLAAALAFFIYFANRAKIKTALNTLVGYSFQLSIAELKEKLERLNDLNANDESERAKIELIFSEVIGQIKGNTVLKARFSEMDATLDILVGPKSKLTEQRKRSAVSELRERLRHINVESMDKLMSGEANG